MFEFAKYTEVTELAHKVNPAYKLNNYSRVFLCPDVKCIWLSRILEGVDGNYERCEGAYLVERNYIDDHKNVKLGLSQAQKILKNDDLDNWDYIECDSLEHALNIIDGGYGINNRLSEDEANKIISGSEQTA